MATPRAADVVPRKKLHGWRPRTVSARRSADRAGTWADDLPRGVTALHRADSLDAARRESEADRQGSAYAWAIPMDDRMGFGSVIGDRLARRGHRRALSEPAHPDVQLRLDALVVAYRPGSDQGRAHGRAVSTR